MPETMTLVELARSSLRLEAMVNQINVKLDTTILGQVVNRAMIDSVVEDVAELKERERFRARAVATAIVTALAGPILILFQVKK